MDRISYILTVINMVVMVIMIIMIAMQNKSAGLSNIFGGSANVVQTRRGAEKWLFYATIAMAVVFVGLSITTLLIRN